MPELINVQIPPSPLPPPLCPSNIQDGALAGIAAQQTAIRRHEPSAFCTTSSRLGATKTAAVCVFTSRKNHHERTPSRPQVSGVRRLWAISASPTINLRRALARLAAAIAAKEGAEHGASG